MPTIKQIFDTILTGNKDKAKEAAGALRKNVFGGRKDEEENFDFKSYIADAPKIYGEIKEEWRREYFVRAVSVIYFLHGFENQPDLLFPWFYQLLQNKNGIVRHSPVRMITNDL